MFYRLIRAFSPGVRRREAEAAERQRQVEEAEEAQKRRDMAARQEREARKLKEDAYNAHVDAVDLNGLVTKKRGSPLSVSEIMPEVTKRFSLATAVGADLCIILASDMTDNQIEAAVGQPDQTALYWLLEHDEPTRQRQAAERLLNARADLRPTPSLDEYTVLIGEAAARARGAQYARNRIVLAVVARAILRRSASTRWDQTAKRGPRPLSEKP